MHCSHHQTASRQLYRAQQPSPSRLGIRPCRSVPAKARMMLLWLKNPSAIVERISFFVKHAEHLPVRTEPPPVSQWAAWVLWEQWKCLCPSNGKSQQRNEEVLNNIIHLTKKYSTWCIFNLSHFKQYCLQLSVVKLPAANETQHCSFWSVIGLMRYGTSAIVVESGGRAGKRPTPHIWTEPRARWRTKVEPFWTKLLQYEV